MDVLVCDLDGVVRRYDSTDHAATEERHGLKPGTLGQAAFSAPELHDAVRGRISDEAWREAVRGRLVAVHGDGAGAAFDEWNAHVGELDDSVVCLLRQVRRGTPVVLLTNATSRLSADLATLGGLAGAVDTIVSSAQLGAAKPDQAAFAAAAAAGLEHSAGIGPEPRFALIDDTPAHVAAAERLGWQGHVYTGPDNLRIWLAELGLMRA